MNTGAKFYEFQVHTQTPKIPPSRFCKDCEIYQDRLAIANTMNRFFGRGGHWDYATCYKACEKKLQKKSEYDRVKALEYYHNGRRNK